MLDHIDTLNLSVVLRPYGQAERALGRLAHALETTSLHATWLWRELTRVSVLIAQAGGYQTRVDQLRMALIGAPLERDDHTPGLAAATRTFLDAAPLFHNRHQTDSKTNLWPSFWQSDSDALLDDGGAVAAPERAGEVEGPQQGDRLSGLVRELAGFADDGRRPALINLLVDLRKHAATRQLPPGLVRMALPLALTEAGQLPRAAPGLLGGRRLTLGMSRAVKSDKPLTDWLGTALGDLAKEAETACHRLQDLTRQHQAWHGALAKAGLRRHARAPKALDLLAATPVLTIGLVARHLDCSHVAAGMIVALLVDLGILIEQTARLRHKVFVAGDLKAAIQRETGAEAPLSLSEPTPAVDVDAVGATLDALFGELDRLNQRTRSALDGAG